MCRSTKFFRDCVMYNLSIMARRLQKDDQHGARTRNLLIIDVIVVRHTTNCANRPITLKRRSMSAYGDNARKPSVPTHLKYLGHRYVPLAL